MEENMKRTWSIGPYREGDEEGIFELDKAVHPSQERNREQWMRWWRWMYRENPAGNGRIWVAEHEGRIVGQSAAIPVAMKIGSKEVIGFQSIDTMTHPNYQRQGIYVTLAQKVYAQLAKEGVIIGYRFPNRFSHPIAIKRLNWFDVSTLHTRFKLLNSGNVLKLRFNVNNRFLLRLCGIGGNLADKMFFRAKKAPTVDGLTITRVSSFDQRINELWNVVSSQHPIMVVRNRDYLNWRYVTIPDVDYSIYIADKAGEVYGYLVLRCMRKRRQTKVGVIFDIVAQSKQIAQCLISKAIEYCKQEKVDLIRCDIIANKTYLKALRLNGFISIPESFRFGGGMQLCAYSSSPHISKEFLKDPQNWFVQRGDSDAI